MFAPQIWREIRRGGYDAVVVHGHAVPANHIALAAAKSAGLPVFHRTETHLGLTRSRWKQAVRAAVMPRYYAMFDGMLAIGAANRDFYRAMHVPERRISLFPYTVDNERFARAARLDAAERRELRRRLGLTGDRPAVLFAGKFLPRKRPDDLIRAAHRLAAEGVEFDLVIAGGGEMDAELRRLAAEAAAPRVHFPGFFNQSEMPKLLAACDLFVLPSRDEPWGLIINEAMCAALPIVASRDIGAVRDLVFDGVNGQSFDGGDVQGLADALRPIIFDAGLRQEMGKASRDIISGWNYDRCEAGLREALSRAGVRGVSG